MNDTNRSSEPNLADYIEKWSKKYLAPSAQEMGAREEYTADLARYLRGEIKRLESQQAMRPASTSSNHKLADELEAAEVEDLLGSDLLDRVTAALRASPDETTGQRTPKDYAIEHGGYLADAAESFIKAVDEHARIVLGFAGEDPDPSIEAPDMEKAEQAECDHRDALRNAVYEFRKRAERAKHSPEEPSDNAWCAKCGAPESVFQAKCSRNDCPREVRQPEKASGCTGCNSTPCVCAELRSAQNGDGKQNG